MNVTEPGNKSNCRAEEFDARAHLFHIIFPLPIDKIILIVDEERCGMILKRKNAVLAAAGIVLLATAFALAFNHISSSISSDRVNAASAVSQVTVTLSNLKAKADSMSETGPFARKRWPQRCDRKSRTSDRSAAEHFKESRSAVTTAEAAR